MGISLIMSYHERFIANLIHVIADYSIVEVIILCCSHWKSNIKIPSILALLTFDIYLIHFKVLIVMQHLTPSLPLIIFIISTLLLSSALLIVRKKIIK